jgi:hypothetical protein
LKVEGILLDGRFMHLDMTARQHDGIVNGAWAETREEPPPLMIDIVLNAVWESPRSIDRHGDHAVAQAYNALDFN